ncbi:MULTISPECIES: UbiA family prenyltransferase [unclassified Streptomyces]|uniref:UbiA family prenyltransferase n=1 Tax=unclassified Streptomyces TaxID=2593676 RepID=UPI00278BEEFE|nr:MULTISPECIES: UbiA family prenyltransferase [unclassified Streptomyces]
MLAVSASAGTTDKPVIQAGLGAFSWFCAILYTYLRNGLEDLHEDRVNGSTRPLASGQLSRRAALTMAYGALAAALVAAAAAGPAPLILCAVLLFLGHAYSAPPFAWKNRTSAAMGVVLASGLLTYCAGPAALGVPVYAPGLLVMSAGMSLWMALVGAVAKDLSDIAGDAAAGRRTWAVTLGERRTRLLVAAGALAVGAGFTGAALRWAPGLLPTAVVMLVGGAVLAAVALADGAAASRRAGRRPYRVFMVTQHLAHLSLLAQAAV